MSVRSENGTKVTEQTEAVTTAGPQTTDYVDTVRPETTTEMEATTQVDVVELNETDTRQSKNYYIYRRDPPRTRGSLKFTPTGTRYHNRIHPVPVKRPVFPKRDFVYMERKKSQVPPVPSVPKPEHQYKVQESAEDDLGELFKLNISIQSTITVQ